MMRSQLFHQLAAYGISLPAFAVSPKLAKETVYMPSRVAEQTLGARASEAEQPASTNEREIDNSEDRKGLTRLKRQDGLL